MDQIKQKIKNRLSTIIKPSYLPSALRKHLRQRHPIYFIDIGAHKGLFTKSIEQYCGIINATLIEPLPDKAEYLRKYFSSIKYHIIEGVISNKNEQVEFEINEYDQTSSILSINRSMYELSKVKVNQNKKIFRQAYTLDKILEEVRFPYIDLVKIDVQGAEHFVINGAPESLKHTSMIWTEISFKSLYKGSSTFSEIYQLLNEKGFRLIEIEPGFRSPDGELLQGDALFMK